MNKLATILFLNIILCVTAVAEDFSFRLPAAGKLSPKVALALSGGGARGFSQIGVLKSFEKNGIRIDYISGTSIGAIVGGLYACGYNAQELEDIILSNDWKETVAISKNRRSDLFIDQKEIYDKSLITIKFNNFDIVPPEAISSGNPFDSFIQKIFWNAPSQPESNFDSLKIPFRAVATDLASGKSVSFAEGNITKIVRASATIPLRYTPVRIGSMILVDGGVMSNIPVEPLYDFNPDIILAVNSTSPLLEAQELNNAWNLADQVVSIAMEKFSNASINKSDITIHPKMNNHSNSNFEGIDSLVGFGYEAAELQINNINELIDNKIYEKIRVFVQSNNMDRAIFPFQLTLINFPIHLENSIKSDFNQINSIADISRLIFKIVKNDFSYDSIDFIISGDNLELKYIANEQISVINTICPHNKELEIKLNNYLLAKFIGKYYNKYNMSEIKDSIYRFLRENNIHLTKVDSPVYKNGLLSFEIDDNQIDQIKIEGSSAKNFIIERDLAFKVGDHLAVEQLIDSWDNLINTDLFSDVEILPYRDKDDKLVVKVSLKDGGTQTLRLGGRIDSERNAQAGLLLIQENLFNFGGRLSGQINFSESFLNTKLKLENARLFSSDLNFAVDVYYNRWKGFEYSPLDNLPSNHYENKRIFNYDVENIGSSITGGVQIARDGTLYSKLRFEYQKFNRDSDTSKKDFYPLSTIKFGVLWDNLNDRYFPTNGRSIEMSLESNLLQNPDIVGFSKAKMQYSSYYNIGGHTISPSLRFGVADASLPYPEFFFLGGEDSFFGLLSEELLGRQIFSGSISYRILMPFEIFFDTYLFARFDIGNVWNKEEDIKLSNLRQGFGLGIAINTPVGPAKFSYGRSIFSNNQYESVIYGPSVFYFSIGLNLN